MTLSPDENQNLFMLRFSRARRKDPILLSPQVKDQKRFYDRYAPTLQVDTDDVLLQVSVDELRQQVPSYDSRRKMLVSDPLASVDGFRIMVYITYEHLFGVRMCPRCPDCNHGKGSVPCQYFCCSNAKAEGGFLGRIDVVYTSIEGHQSSGSLHAHSQLFVQRLHQHTSLYDILDFLRKDDGDTIQEYLRYRSHMVREAYAGDMSTLPAEAEDAERTWPAHKHDEKIVSLPSYLHTRFNGDRNYVNYHDTCGFEAEGREWARQHLMVYVRQMQTKKQHHVHTINEHAQKREPFTSCRRKGNPALSEQTSRIRSGSSKSL